MKFVCSAETLSACCQNVQRAISNKATMPALEGILIRAQEGKLWLTGYDLEVGIQTSMEAEVLEEGALVLNAKVFCEILRRVPGDTIALESDARCLAGIVCGESSYRINGQDAEEYPELPSITGGSPLLVPQAVLKEMIRQTIFAVAVNPDTKPVHTGVKFEVTAGELRLAAIDGFRLALRREPISYDGEEMSFVVPPKTLKELVTLAEGDEDVSISVGRRHIVFDLGGYHVVSRLLDGEFMNYEMAIPAEHTTESVVDTREMIAAIERISLIITEKVKSPIRCDVQTKVGRMEFTCITGVGTARDTINANITGEAFEVGFNNRFLLDALRACDTDEVKMMFAGPVAPAIILPPEGNAFLFMVLPVRLKAE